MQELIAQGANIEGYNYNAEARGSTMTDVLVDPTPFLVSFVLESNFPISLLQNFDSWFPQIARNILISFDSVPNNCI